jgi:hypothetical protein
MGSGDKTKTMREASTETPPISTKVAGGMHAKKLTLTISILIPLLKSIKSHPRTKFRISIFKILNLGNKDIR